MASFVVFCLISVISINYASALTADEISFFKSRTHEEGNSGLQGTVSVETFSETLVLKSNGIPDHDTGLFDGNPNSIDAQTYEFTVKKDPTHATSSSCTPMGPIGMAVNGVAIFNPYTSECCDAGMEEFDLLDQCHGHPSPRNAYHYHIAPICLGNICANPSQILGVAFDGFPIYGPFDEDGNFLTRAELDECGGMETRNGEYRYHVTDEFPYIIGCFKGDVIDENVLRRMQGVCTCTEVKEPCTQFGDRKKRQIQKRAVDSAL
uniref:uncharacterized protein LOC120331156 n=1 Tax=Styela clava TaxID=7725 RepID=UPI0019397578